MTESRFVFDTNAVIFLTTRGNVIPSGLVNDLDDADLFIIIAATAVVLNATLLTNDLKLLRLEWPGFTAKNIS